MLYICTINALSQQHSVEKCSLLNKVHQRPGGALWALADLCRGRHVSSWQRPKGTDRPPAYPGQVADVGLSSRTRFSSRAGLPAGQRARLLTCQARAQRGGGRVETGSPRGI